MSFVLGILKVVILLGTLVTIHELGHFLVAKACNIKVHKFAIGFGPKILSKVKGETEYAFRAIPFGGFVQMEGEDNSSDDARAFNNKPIWQKMLVVVAGATVNILFAFLLYYLVTVSVDIYALPIIDNLDENSIAYTSGLRENDVIKLVDDKKVYFANEISTYISESDKDNVIFTVERNNELKKIKISIPEKEVGYLGTAFSENGEIVYIQDGSVAHDSKLQEGDIIIAINGKNYSSITEFVECIKSSPNKNLEIAINRNGKTIVVNVIPEGKNVKIFDANFKIVSGCGFLENSYYAIKETKYYFSETIKGFAKLISGKMENASVMGPIGISGQITNTHNVIEFFYLMSAISFSLGVCNLFPIPGLDGGKFLILVIEMIRKKPMNQKTEIAIQLAGFTIIIGLAIFVTVKDIINLF